MSPENCGDSDAQPAWKWPDIWGDGQVWDELLEGHKEGGYARKVLKTGLSRGPGAPLFTHTCTQGPPKAVSPLPPGSQSTTCHLPAGSSDGCVLTAGTWASEASQHLVQDLGSGSAFPTLLTTCNWIQGQATRPGVKDTENTPPGGASRWRQPPAKLLSK